MVLTASFDLKNFHIVMYQPGHIRQESGREQILSRDFSITVEEPSNMRPEVP